MLTATKRSTHMMMRGGSGLFTTTRTTTQLQQLQQPRSIVAIASSSGAGASLSSTSTSTSLSNGGGGRGGIRRHPGTVRTFQSSCYSNRTIMSFPSRHPQQQQLRVSSMATLAVAEDGSDDDDENNNNNNNNNNDNNNNNARTGGGVDTRNQNTGGGVDNRKMKHCATCTCDEHDPATTTTTTTTPTVVLDFDKGRGGSQNDDNDNQTEDEQECELGSMQRSEPYPLPLEEPKYTFLRRVLDPSTAAVVALDSPQGKQRLIRSLIQNTSESFTALMSHFTNQSEPAYCGITTLMIVLNAFCVDPLLRWKGGWRYFGNEQVLLQKCCLDPERIRRAGIHMNQFAQLATCQGLTVQLKRPSSNHTLDDLRNHVKNVLSYNKPTASAATTHDDHNNYTNDEKEDHSYSLRSLLVVSYARWELGQTGDAGHFSPIAAYDEETDSVLILDVARFKYPPYWCSLRDLYRAMTPIDPSTKQSRGWIIIHPPPYHSQYYQGSKLVHEAKLPAHQIPKVGTAIASHCPAQAVKVEFCPNNNTTTTKNTTNNHHHHHHNQDDQHHQN